MWLFQKQPSLPRGYKEFEPTVVTSRAGSPLRERFSMKKVPKDLDFIVIGSGGGGMYAAALLSRLGKKVLVVEQHYVAGGCMHEFEIGGFKFDTGVEYIALSTIDCVPTLLLDTTHALFISLAHTHTQTYTYTLSSTPFIFFSVFFFFHLLFLLGFFPTKHTHTHTHINNY